MSQAIRRGRGDVFVARYNVNGTLDTTFAGKGYTRLDIDGAATATSESAFNLSIQPDGKIVIVGQQFMQSDTSTQNVLVARFNSNGTPDAGFGAGGFKIGAAPADHAFYAECLLVQPDGDIIVAGYHADGSTTHPLVMRFYGSDAPEAPTASASDFSADATDAALMLLLNDTTITTKKRK